MNKKSSDPIKPFFDIVPPEADEIASVLVDINFCLDDNILYNRLNDRTNLSKYQISVSFTTTTCGQYILDDDNIVGIMDGSLNTNTYNGYTVSSLAGSIFDKYQPGKQDGHTPTDNINQYHNNNTNNK